MTKKILIMAVFLLWQDRAEQAWFMGSAIVMLSLLVHSAAKPYEDERIDWCACMHHASLAASIVVTVWSPFGAYCSIGPIWQV